MIGLAAGAARATLDPDDGGRVTSLVVDEAELLVPRAPDGNASSYGCFPMVPWAGRIRDGRFTWQGVTHQLPVNLPPHAIHGTGFTRPWNVVAADERSTRMEVDLGPDWPFAGHAVHALGLTPDGLDLRLEVHAAGEPFPAWCGWHPWWRRPVELSFHPGAMYRRDATGIPTGELVAVPPGPWDDCFTRGADPPVLRWPSGLSVAVESSADYFVVYDQLDHAVCVEPQTAPPDAVNLGLATVIEPGRPLVARAAFRWGRPILDIRG